MPSDRELFFELPSFVVIGNSDVKSFPKRTYRNLRQMGRTVYPVELGGKSTVEGDKAYGSVAELPESVQGAIIELPRKHTMAAVKQVADAGIKDLWLHMLAESDEVLQFCKENEIRVRYGTCAVMYTQQGPSYHSIHKKIMQLLDQY